MTTSELLPLSRTQWLGQASVTKRNGWDQNPKLWLKGEQ